MNNIKLAALDLDGTLFNNQSQITPGNFDAIRCAVNTGINIVISTGRPYRGLPFDQLKGSGIQYAITTNGSAIYDLTTDTCLFEDCMDNDIFLPIMDFLLQKDIHMDAFIGGKGYSPLKCLPAAQKLEVPESLKQYIITTRTRIENFPAYIMERPNQVQKVTINFYPNPDGSYHDREETKAFLLSNPHISTVSGGYHNLEFTKAGVTKGTALVHLANLLGISMEQTMAIGDSENDLAILNAAGIGIAMGNAAPEILAGADDVTLTNEEDGVACALRKYLLL